ncbi:YtxH domain-containing protein [Listeria monocytogenes]|nr:YtxH domain-containing protein [Listeria monocytogenes]EGP7089644.1 YtxH domain-containing protein [Listeria monocytogenes]EGP7933702.1 YtxH domain-containing protein [Listeria monocytogenes]EGP8470112.1 YtxH domain-containing protein [Listeria monocytogenes]
MKSFIGITRLKEKWNLKQISKMAVTGFLILVIAILLLATLGTVAHATGLVDDTVNTTNAYSKYPLGNYQLDFYVDNSWGWLPWNWSDGIGKQVMYGLYAITNFIWTISLYLSNATGYLVQEAYSLDFISSTADSVGKNMQTLAGVTSSGLSSEGFYIGFLLILILILGVYVAYTGLIKRETTKAIHAIVNFVMVFVLSASFIAYAPDYINKINDFSSDISNASLSLGTKIVMPHSDSQGKDSVDLIRDSLFSIQVQQPWLLLQYDNSDIESIGVERVENLLSASPDTNNGEDRETIVKEEIEDRDNANLTITKTINRLGTVFFLFIFNIGISIFVFLLAGIMIFSQVLFIIYAMFLPVSFILSMIPSFDGMSKRAITKLFNTILTRAGITLIITTAFSISTMLYTLSEGYPFFLIAFLQIVTFAGIYFKLGDLMSMFSLQSNDSQSVGSRIMRKPRMLMHAYMHRLQRKVGRAMTALGSGTAIASATGKGQSGSGSSARTRADHSRPDKQEKSSLGKRAGQKIGAIADTKDRIKDNAGNLKEQVKDLPNNARYALYQGKSKVTDNVRDLTTNISQTKSDRASGRKEEQEQRRTTIAERRTEMEQAKQKKQSVSTNHARPTIRQKTYEKRNRRPEQFHERPNARQENSYKQTATRPTAAPINKTKTQEEKPDRPTSKVNSSNPKTEVQNNIPTKRPIHRSTVSSPTVKTIRRPVTRENMPIIQQKPVKNIRNKTISKTTPIKRNGEKS